MKDKAKIDKIAKLLKSKNREQFATLLNAASIKESDQIREIIPVRQWVNDPFYIGKDGVERLYPGWKELICDIFENGQKYTQVCITGGIGCRPISTAKYETSKGILSLLEISHLLDAKEKVFINTEAGIEEIIATHIIGNKNTITITLSDGCKFEGSEDHLLRVLTTDNVIIFKKLKDISDKDFILKSYNAAYNYGLNCSNNKFYSDIIEQQYVNEYIKEKNLQKVYITNKEYDNKLVGDIEVAGSHTYIADGLINHNTGKSTVGLYILLRKLYELSCYKNVAGLFNMMGNSFTAFLYFSLTKFQAERTGFRQFREIIDGVPYFNEIFSRDKHHNTVLDFPENIRIFYGASTGDMIGMNVIASILDEANFFGDSSGSDVDYGSVVKLHDSIMSRQSSRYTKDGVNHSLSIVISSSTFQSSYTQKMYERSLTDPNIKYVRARLWELKPKGTYSSEYFYVFAGNDKFDPFIIDSTIDISAKLGISLDPSLSIPEAISRLTQEYRELVDEVPMDFYSIYKSNIIQGLQDFSGFSVESTGKLFTNRRVFESCVDENIQELFSKNEFTIETNNNDISNCIQFYLKGIKFPHPECPRYLHVDIGLANDAYGIACCYKNGIKIVDGIECPEYFYDFSLRIVPPPPPKKISIARCHEFIKYMRDNLGLKIGLVSFDQFQSSASQQYLDELGIPVKYQSVDKTDTQYLYFVDSLYRGHVHFSKEFAEAIQNELFNLIFFRAKHKIDHPSDTKHGGCKDRMDSVVGALYNAYTTKENIVNTEDILNLSLYNSDNYDNYDNYHKTNIENFEELSQFGEFGDFVDITENDLNYIKFVSSKDL